MQLLRGRGIQKFEGDEGSLYTLLHRQNRIALSNLAGITQELNIIN